MSGLNQYPAKVPDLIFGPEGSNPSASANGEVAQLDRAAVYEAAGCGFESLPHHTCMEVWQSWSIAPVLKTGRRKRLKGSNPLASAKHRGVSAHSYTV